MLSGSAVYSFFRSGVQEVISEFRDFGEFIDQKLAGGKKLGVGVEGVAGAEWTLTCG